MSQQSINLGSQVNDGTGDSIRDAFDKVNTNFTEVYSDLTLFNTVFSTGTQALSSALATVYSVTATMANFSATQALFQQDLNDVANILVTKIESVTPLAGTGIGITNIDSTPPGVGFTINNVGVTSLTAGTRVTVSQNTGGVTVSVPDVGVTQLTGSAYLNVSASTGSVTLSNTGVTNLAGSTYINVSASTGSVTISNSGVQTLTAGTSTRVSSSTGTITIWAEIPSTPSFQDVTTVGSTTTNEITISSSNAHGGAGYAGLLTFTNASTGSTNPNKFVRMDSTGTLQIIDSGYGNTLFSLTDSGSVTIKDKLTVSGNLQVTGTISGVKGLGLGGETWNNVTSSRTSNVNSTNTNAYPIMVMITVSNVNGLASFYVNDVAIATSQVATGGAVSLTSIVPAGSTYKVDTGLGTITTFFELY
jgi:hypothetical protein